ncbi:hypothetical protein WJX72_000714 [[Myrmecia] bisecta]|uniref:Rrn7/TAF1B N-terminal cyclin domain-containing protein n=1 Tax=[Myrmecia] bisecta TaxID=41462 RepID=A0AAW1R4J5_9CHLO
MASATTCFTCFSTSLSLRDGVLVCDVCGTQSQSFVEETQEFQTGVDDSRYRRRHGSVHQARNQGRLVEEAVKLDTPKLACCYCHCLQHGLQKQVAALCELAGSPKPELSDMVQRLWFAFLASTQLLEPVFVRDGVSSRTRRPVPEETAEAAEAPAGVASKSEADALHALLHHVAPPETLLAVCFLGCWYLREAVSAMDIVRWAQSGQLPFLSLSSVCEQVVVQHDVLLPAVWLQPAGVPAPHHLVNAAAGLADLVNLPKPPVNAGALIHRYLLELGLPEGLGAAAMHIFAVHRAGSDHMQLTKQANLKARALGPSCYPLFPGEVSQLEDSGSLHQYLAYLQDQVFPGYAPPEDVGDFHRILKSIESEPPCGEPPSTPGVSTQHTSIDQGNVPQAVLGEYTLWGKAWSWKALHVHPDYAAVLCACATHLWLHPLHLHHLLCQLEVEVCKADAEAHEALVQGE